MHPYRAGDVEIADRPPAADAVVWVRHDLEGDVTAMTGMQIHRLWRNDGPVTAGGGIETLVLRLNHRWSTLARAPRSPLGMSDRLGAAGKTLGFLE